MRVHLGPSGAGLADARDGRKQAVKAGKRLRSPAAPRGPPPTACQDPAPEEAECLPKAPGQVPALGDAARAEQGRAFAA